MHGPESEKIVNKIQRILGDGNYEEKTMGYIRKRLDELLEKEGEEIEIQGGGFENPNYNPEIMDQMNSILKEISSIAKDFNDDFRRLGSNYYENIKEYIEGTGSLSSVSDIPILLGGPFGQLLQERERFIERLKEFYGYEGREDEDKTKIKKIICDWYLPRYVDPIIFNIGHMIQILGGDPVELLRNVFTGEEGERLAGVWENMSKDQPKGDKTIPFSRSTRRSGKGRTSSVPISTEQKGWELAPGLSNVGKNYCFHNSVAQLFYRMKDLSTFMIRDDVIDMYTNDQLKQFLKLVEEMLQKSSNNLAEKKKGHEIDPQKYITSCKLVEGAFISEEGPLRQSDALTFLIRILGEIMLDCDNRDKEKVNLNIAQQNYCYDKGSGKQLKLNFKTSDPRRSFIINKQTIFGDSTTYTLESLFKINIGEYTNAGISALFYQTINATDKTDTGSEIKYNHAFGKYIVICLKDTLKIKATEDGTITVKKKQYTGEISDNIQTVSNNYKLAGLISHSGTDEAGHYVSFIEHEGNWYKYNDHDVTQIDKTQIRNGNFTPYIILYESDDIETQIPEKNIKDLFAFDIATDFEQKTTEK